MDTIIIRRRWGWIGHVLRIDPGNITRTVLHWTPQGKRKRGRSKNTRRWAVERERELKTLNHTWGITRKLAHNRQEWRTFVTALHASGRYGQQVTPRNNFVFVSNRLPNLFARRPIWPVPSRKNRPHWRGIGTRTPCGWAVRHFVFLRRKKHHSIIGVS